MTPLIGLVVVALVVVMVARVRAAYREGRGTARTQVSAGVVIGSVLALLGVVAVVVLAILR